MHQTAWAKRSSILLYSCAIALFLQEVFLVQIAHRKENIEYPGRLFSGKVTNTKRLLVMASPFILSMAVGLAMMALNLGSMEFPVVMRIFAVGVIITLGIDPIIGLFDKGPVAMFGAVVIYGIVVNAGLKTTRASDNSLAKTSPCFPQWPFPRLLLLTYSCRSGGHTTDYFVSNTRIGQPFSFALVSHLP